ncbi:hypothetical protein VIBNISOn1_1840076 [Vibrio nigripulchritudo SOn1]|uniref:Uncharacterized protein n=1 Tax=Vibrio nigripulchritudo SOn1 TaxID=1238450 RepID=A0AAV2VQH7_9VIBR|nr:hypothetical protein [Vibrio nigripulchritudo]CCO46693.1 hypothetical protein VIBNISOn1_1840076 [Vibrio nigripulchritudo SOn1]
MEKLLNNKPEVALKQVAAALRETRKGSDRAIKEDGEVLGYWQTPEFIEYLLELADECDRVSVNSLEEGKVENGQVHFSMDGFRTQLSDDVKELRDLVDSVVKDEWFEKDDLTSKMNDVICKSNSVNCISLDGCESFSNLSSIEVELIDLEGC